jgi:hypothetical protein
VFLHVRLLPATDHTLSHPFEVWYLRSIAERSSGRNCTSPFCRGKMIMSYLGKVEMSY